MGQAGVQFINALAGIILVRSLPKEQFAWFTILSAMSALVSCLGDSGLQSGLMVIGGRVYRDREDFSKAVVTSLRLRFWLTGAALAMVSPLSWVLLTRNGTTPGIAGLLVASTVMGILPAARMGAFVAAVRLQGKYLAPVVADLTGSTVRLCGNIATALFAPLALWATLSASASQWISVQILRKRVSEMVDLSSVGSSEYRNEQIGTIKTLWFPVLFAAFQGQIGTWVLSVFGRHDSVAEIGAISRFSSLFTIIGSIIPAVIGPKFAIHDDYKQLRKIFSFGILYAGMCCGSLILAVILFPKIFIWILGSKYAILENSLVLFFLNGSIGIFTMLVWSLVSNKAWIKGSWLIPLITIIVQIVSAVFLNLSELRQVLWMMIITGIPGLILSSIMATKGILKLKNGINKL